jgi:hypothetical protein
MNLQVRTSTDEDLKQLQQSLDADPDHGGQLAGDWNNTSGQLLTWTSGDEILYFTRLEKETAIRISFQQNIHARRKQLVVGMRDGILHLKTWGKQNGYRSLVFSSVADKLIAFFAKLGFGPANDYKAGV